MLASLKEIMQWAEEEECAAGAFDTPSLESVMAVLAAAEAREQPVIIQHAQIHEVHMPLDIIGPVMVDLARRARVPVCVQLDHGTTASYLERAMNIGFTSVMYDGSMLPYEENVRRTKEIVSMAQRYGVNVEAEIGHVAGHETMPEETDGKNAEETAEEEAYTDPKTAQRFVLETGIDALAASFGTVHGFYKTAPKLDFDRIEEIQKLTGKPLVMHGGSGICAEDYQESIRRGIRKINYFSYMSSAGVQGVRKAFEEQEVQYFFEIMNRAMAEMKAHVTHAMEIFSMK